MDMAAGFSWKPPVTRALTPEEMRAGAEAWRGFMATGVIPAEAADHCVTSRQGKVQWEQVEAITDRAWRSLLDMEKLAAVSSDDAAGFVPLPDRSPPEREVPAFPAATYAFLKR